MLIDLREIFTLKHMVSFISLYRVIQRLPVINLFALLLSFSTPRFVLFFNEQSLTFI